jgi:hypothetical protein
MTFPSFRAALAMAVIAIVASRHLEAADIIAGSTALPSRAIQDITLLPDTPFNQTGSEIFLPDLSGIGTIIFNRDTQTGSTIPILSLSGGQYYGSYPGLGSYVFGNIAPLTGADFDGVITNVVQNPADPGFGTGQPSSFQSGDFSFGGNSFGFEFLGGPLDGIKLFTDPSVPFSFSAQFDGLPPNAGTLLVNSGPDVLNILFNGQIVATSSNRRILVLDAIPEPSSLVMLGLGACGVVGAVARRRTA